METGARETRARLAWYALRTMSRHEKLAGRRLEALGLKTFVPTYEQESRWSDRTKTISRMLFPGYIFCRFARGDFPRVRATSGVLYVVPVSSEPLPVREEEIENLRRAIESGVHLEPVRRLQRGRLVEVVGGPLRGVVGRFIRHAQGGHLLLAIDLLQQGALADLKLEDVRPVSR